MLNVQTKYICKACCLMLIVSIFVGKDSMFHFSSNSVLITNLHVVSNILINYVVNIFSHICSNYHMWILLYHFMFFFKFQNGNAHFHSNIKSELTFKNRSQFNVLKSFSLRQYIFFLLKSLDTNCLSYLDQQFDFTYRANVIYFQI